MDESRHNIPVVILCGGMGTRIREASERLPKPLVDIGGQPILWHIMKLYSHYGYRRFILALGYKSEEIKRYFLDYRMRVSDFTLELRRDHGALFHNAVADEDWEITFAETGLQTGTGARVKRIAPYIDGDRFLLTYGDGVGNIDIGALVDDHTKGGRTATVTAVHPVSRYGEMGIDETRARVVEFNEKPTVADGWVSGGFFVFERDFLTRYLNDDVDLFLEHAPLRGVARDGQLTVHPHEGFWMGMDTYRDWLELNRLWDSGEAPWKLWR